MPAQYWSGWCADAIAPATHAKCSGKTMDGNKCACECHASPQLAPEQTLAALKQSHQALLKALDSMIRIAARRSACFGCGKQGAHEGYECPVNDARTALDEARKLGEQE